MKSTVRYETLQIRCGSVAQDVSDIPEVRDVLFNYIKELEYPGTLTSLALCVPTTTTPPPPKHDHRWTCHMIPFDGRTEPERHQRKAV